MIDTDNSGSLQAKELKNKLGDQYDMKYYHQLISFFDDDKDGEVFYVSYVDQSFLIQEDDENDLGTMILFLNNPFYFIIFFIILILLKYS